MEPASSPSRSTAGPDPLRKPHVLDLLEEPLPESPRAASALEVMATELRDLRKELASVNEKMALMTQQILTLQADKAELQAALQAFHRIHEFCENTSTTAGDHFDLIRVFT